MGKQDMARLAEHAKRNPEFLAAFRQDPVEAARSAGFDVADNEADTMRRLDFPNLSDDQIRTVIETFFMYH